MTDSKIRANLRDKLVQEFMAWANETYGTALLVKGNKVAVAVLDEKDDDRWAEFTIAVPTGARDDEEGYDAELLAQDYADHMAEMKAKKEQKQKKIEADALARKQKAEEKKAQKKSEKEGD